MRMMIHLLIALLAAGCEPTPAERAEAYVAGWSIGTTDGGRLPTDQVPFFAEHLEEATPALRAVLADGDADVRQSAAYIIGEVGPAAGGFEADLRARVGAESDRVVRMYLYDALRSINAREEATLAALRGRYDAAADAEEDGGCYAPVDERIALAGSLFGLDPDDGRRREYEAFAVRFLEEDAAGASEQSRWMAVTTLADMPGATSAVGPLRGMLEERDAPAWVGPKVRAALAGIGDG